MKEFAIKGFVPDKKRLENGSFLGEDYFERLLEKIREIRLSERRFYLLGLMGSQNESLTNDAKNTTALNQSHRSAILIFDIN